LNPALSNGAWATKSKLLGDHPVLHLNMDLLAEFGSVDWSESTIRERGAALAARVTTIWASPPEKVEA